MGKKEKLLVFALVVVVIANIFHLANKTYTALTKPAPAYGGQFREGVLGQPRLINPIVGTSSTDEALIRLVYSGLYTYDNSGNLVPDLAESLPQISEDQKQYTIKLRENAQWHNGTKVTAADVVFTVRLLQNPDFNSPLRNQWLNTVVEKNGDYTIIFANKDISAPFIHNLTLPILPEGLWSSIPASSFVLSNLNLEAIGSGPYVIKEIKKLPSGKIQHIRLESFSNYHHGKPYIDNLTMLFYEAYDELVAALHAKTIDGFGYVSLDATIPLDEQKNNVAIRQLPIPQYQAAFFNLKNSVVAELAVRKALSLATDSHAIRQQVFMDTGLPLNGPILPEQLRSAEKPSPTAPNINLARATLDEAGWMVDPATGLRTKQGKPLELTITTNDFALNTKTAQTLAEQWRMLNIKVNLNTLPTAEFTNTVLPSRSYDVLVFALRLSPDPDPFIFWHSSQINDPGLNITQFSNAEADKVISEARNTTDFELRKQKYQRFQEIVAAEVPAIFLNQTVFVYATRTEIKNITLQNIFTPAFRFADTPLWYTEEKRTLK